MSADDDHKGAPRFNMDDARARAQQALRKSEFILSRAFGLLREPKKEWEQIRAEETTVPSILIGYVAPLAAIPPVCDLIGSAIFNSALSGDVGVSLIRAVVKGAAYVDNKSNRDEVSQILARPDRVGVDVETVRRTFEGRLRVNARGEERGHEKYLIVGEDDAGRPDRRQAAWLYAQMLRWRQAPMTETLLETAKGVWRPDLYDAATGGGNTASTSADVVSAFAGPPFDERQMASYLSSFAIGMKI